jgi:NAD(P)-dependent dehydrogenase (short-subunit alcohol dehydrogenase family)
LTQKIALVTGASSGIGQAITEALAGDGYFVFATARRMGQLETLRCDNIEPLYLDVTDLGTINAAISHIRSSKGRIDVLVNNAGYGHFGTIEGLHPDQVRRQFEVNVFGLGQMTRAVLPLMREQGAGVIVNLASIVGRVSLPFAGWYSASKHAVEALSDALRLEVKPFGIKVVIIEPGAINTEFAGKSLEMLDQSQDPRVYESQKRGFRRLIEDLYGKAPGPDIIARIVLKVVKSSKPRPRYAAPLDCQSFIWARRVFGDRVSDWFVRRLLTKRTTI